MLPADVSEDGGVDETGGKVRAMVGRIVLRRRSWLGLVGIVVVQLGRSQSLTL